jgi:hypothetical protein
VIEGFFSDRIINEASLKGKRKMKMDEVDTVADNEGEI